MSTGWWAGGLVGWWAGGLVGWESHTLVAFKGGRDEMRFALSDVDIRRLQSLVRTGKLRLT
jgi:hypothetical protein